MKTGILLFGLGVALLIATLCLAVYFRRHPLPDRFEEAAASSPGRGDDRPAAPSAGPVPPGERTELLPEEPAP